MKSIESSSYPWVEGKVDEYSDCYVKLMCGRFADQVDKRLQDGMVSELMARYAEVSHQLETKNSLLQASDATRLEAQKIALLGNWAVHMPDGNITWSETMYDLLEVEPGKASCLEIFIQRIHPEDLQEVTEAIERLYRGMPVEEMRYRLLLPDGRVKWVVARHVVDFDCRHELQAIHGTLQDITQSKQAELKLEHYSEHLEELVRQKVEEIFTANLATIYALVKLAESRDDDTGAHIERTSQYCQAMAGWVKQGSPYAAQVDDDMIHNIGLASPLHDIGKVGIPDHILLKPGKLTPEEFEIMKTHVTIGYDTLASVKKAYPANKFLEIGMEIARYHHERWNGSGYRDGLSGEAIPLSARIMAISDVYDALRSRRVYKEPYTHETSLRIIADARGQHFDPVLTDLFLQHHNEFRQIYDHAMDAGDASDAGDAGDAGDALHPAEYRDTPAAL